jgi:hypothetical protein
LLDPCPKNKLYAKDTQNKRKEKKSFDWEKKREDQKISIIQM